MKALKIKRENLSCIINIFYVKPSFLLILLSIFPKVFLLFTGRFEGGSEIAEAVVLSPLTSRTEYPKVPNSQRKLPYWGGG
jgi:hypothetical protein